MNQNDHKKACVKALVEAALTAMPNLEPSRRADCYDGIWIACERVAPELAQAAKDTAEVIREADQRQLLFSHLINTDS